MSKYRPNEFRPFCEFDGYQVFEQQRLKIEREIKGQNDDYILNVNKEEYIQYLLNKYSISPLQIHKDEITVSTHVEMVPASRHPNSYFMDNGGSFQRDVFAFHVPFSGDASLLKVRGSTYTMSAPVIAIEQKCIVFKIINFNLTPENIKQQSSQTINNLETENGYVTNDVLNFNASIEQQITQAFDATKAHLLNKNNLIAALGVPVRKSAETSSTFAVPAKRTPAIASLPKPDVTATGYTPEPTLEITIYNQILKIIHDVGKQFERLPSTYSNKEEEHLRDHMLLILEPNFEGSATGETFNKSGKTDILLRYENSNVFIAELKFWTGQKGFLETITQLLGYLTWRDSKAAVVMFVKNKDFTQVLQTAKQSIQDHENYLGFVSENSEGWYNYRFHIIDDKNREVKLAVMFFHVP